MRMKNQKRSLRQSSSSQNLHEKTTTNRKFFSVVRSLGMPIIGLLFGFFLAFLYIHFFRSQSSASPSPVSVTVAEPTPTPTPSSISVLLLGYGGPHHDGGYLTDTIMQAVIQPNDKRILMITIPRDIAVKIPVSETQTRDDKINAAFAIGIDDKNYPNKPAEFLGSKNPGALAKKLVGDITGIPIDYFVAVSFDGFVKAIDVLGGVDVYFEEPFNDYRYPIKGKEQDTCGKSEEEVAALTASLKGDELEKQFPCRYEHLFVPQGTQRLNGELALKVARSRHSTSDFDRSKRQRMILEAMKEKVFQIGFLPKAIPFFLSLGRDVKTDMDVDLLKSLLRYANEMRSYDTVSIALSDENVLTQGYNAVGQFILYPKTGKNDWRSIHDFIEQEATKSAFKDLRQTQE